MHCCLVKSVAKVITNLDLIQIKMKLESNVKKSAKICRFAAIQTMSLLKNVSQQFDQ
jgi:hypothetical protein